MSGKVIIKHRVTKKYVKTTGPVTRNGRTDWTKYEPVWAIASWDARSFPSLLGAQNWAKDHGLNVDDLDIFPKEA
jgi:hypothetical protein